VSDTRSKPPTPEAQAVRAHYDEARRAEVPDIAEVRRYRDELFELVVQHALELMEGGSYEEPDQLPVRFTLRVIENESPILSTPKGPSSPIKTNEIRKFEVLARKVFGNVESCQTVWPEN